METWDNEDGSHTVHWGQLSTQGESKVVKPSFSKPQDKVKEIDKLVTNGYQQAEQEFTLLVEYEVDGFGTSEDLDKRARLQIE